MAQNFGLDSFFLRWLFAIVLVFGTYNPTAYSFVGWTLSEDFSVGPLPALVGMILLIAWIIYLRATFLSLGLIGVVLGAAVFACLIWLLIDLGLLSLDATGALSWIALILVSLLLAAGISWSHIRRRLTGQLDVDDIED
ncbi:MAG: hypothetical protein ACI87W_002984 [Halieaceae bacterium]|jgi:hypothetical protein